MKDRSCKECGSPVDGRCDKLYCNDSCRVAYHNRKFGDKRRTLLKNMRGLMKNYRILSALPANQEIFLPITTLNQLGFDFEAHTLELCAAEGEIRYFCFDIAYKRSVEGLTVCPKSSTSGDDPGGGGALSA